MSSNPSIPTPSADAIESSSVPPFELRPSGTYLKDAHNRTAILHGFNLSGASKMPFHSPTGRIVYTNVEPEVLYDHRNISFVGRPFPLEDADMHFARMKAWGVRLLRVLVTWEALEHEGPGIYDEKYINYLLALLTKAGEHGLKCFLDPHQDCWSRFTGGSGAPGWTLELAGFDLQALPAAGATVLQNTIAGDKHDYIPTLWSTNASKLAALTMWTLFWAGSSFAPRFLVPLTSTVKSYLELLNSLPETKAQSPPTPTHDLINIQHVLKGHFLLAYRHLAQRVRMEKHLASVVLGFDSLNEPSPGFIGRPDLSHLEDLEDLKLGDSPTPFQGLRLGSGEELEVEVWGVGMFGPKKVGKKTIKPSPQGVWNRKVWKLEDKRVVEVKEGCVWAAEGVWRAKNENSQAALLRPGYFDKLPEGGGNIDWLADYWRPYVDAFAAIIRSVSEDFIIFVEPPINEKPPVWSLPKVIGHFMNPGSPRCHSIRTKNPAAALTNLCGRSPDRAATDVSNNLVIAPHFYDGQTNLTLHLHPYAFDLIGYKRGRYLTALCAISLNPARSWSSQVRFIADEIKEQIGSYPVIFGETGIPLSMSSKRAYRNGDYSEQIRGLSWILGAMDRAAVAGYCLWNYCPDNSNEWGDGPWCGEDFSVWCDPAKEFARQSDAACLPCARKKSDPLNDSIREERSKEVYLGGRALEAVIRPYPLRIDGRPIRWEFRDTQGGWWKKKETSFTLVFEEEGPDSEAERPPTEIFLPRFHFPPQTFDVATTGGRWEYHEDEQVVRFWSAKASGEHLDWLKAEERRNSSGKVRAIKVIRTS